MYSLFLSQVSLVMPFKLLKPLPKEPNKMDINFIMEKYNNVWVALSNPPKRLTYKEKYCQEKCSSANKFAHVQLNGRKYPRVT